MSLPNGWVEAEIREIAAINPKHPADTDRSQNVSFVPMPAVDEHLGAIVDKIGKTLGEIWTGYTHFADGDVIFAKITPCMENGKAAVAKGLENGLACGSTEFFVLRPETDISADYLWRFLRQESFREEAGKHMTGAVGQRRVPRPYLESHGLPLPPAAEQRRIVAKLGALSARIARARAELDRVPMLTEKMRQCSVEQLLRGEGWNTVSLEALLSSGPTNGWSPKSGPDAKGTPTLKLTATTSGYLRTDEAAVKRIYEDVPSDSSLWLEPGDLLIQRANALEHVGASAIFTGPRKTFIYPDLMMRVRIPDRNLTKLVWYQLRSPTIRRYFRDNATGTAGNMPKISGTTVRKVPIIVPPANRVEEVVARLDQTFARADRLETEAARARKLLDRLEAVILAKAFRGGLVPQDPNDEPASALLERIRAKRVTAPKAKQTRRSASS